MMMMTRTIAAAAIAAAALLSLAACTPSGVGASASAGSGAATPSVTPASSIPPADGNVVSLFKQVAVSSCGAVPGGWKASGTIKNTGAAHDYKMLVYFTTAQATVIDSASASVTVAAGASASWTASKKFTAPPSMRCVLVSVK